MREFVESGSLKDAELRLRLAEGCPGTAATLDLAKYQERRNLMLKMFECASGLAPFSAWVRAAESFSNRKTEKLDFYLKPAYSVLEDILAASHGAESLRNADVKETVCAIATRVPFVWMEHAVKAVDELALMTRRNIQKTIALDAVIMDLRNQLRVERA